MTFDGLRVHHAELDLAAEHMLTTVRRLDATLAGLEHDIAADVAGWSGSQQESFRSAKAAWDWAMQEMRDLLDESRTTVYESNASYLDADRRGAARFDL